MVHSLRPPPFLLRPLYFLIVISAGDEETKLGLDAAPSTDMALCIIKRCMRSPPESRGGSGRCAVYYFAVEGVKRPSG